MKDYTDPAIIRDSADIAVELLPPLAEKFLPRLGAWCLRTIEALPEKTDITTSTRSSVCWKP